MLDRNADNKVKNIQPLIIIDHQVIQELSLTFPLPSVWYRSEYFEGSFPETKENKI